MSNHQINNQKHLYSRILWSMGGTKNATRYSAQIPRSR